MQHPILWTDDSEDRIARHGATPLVVTARQMTDKEGRTFRRKGG